MKRRFLKRRLKRHKYKFIIVFVLIVGITLAYAALTSTLSIKGNTLVKKATWDVHFENLVNENASLEATIDDSKTTVNYTVTLDKPGDSYEFIVDVVNDGTLDAMVSSVINTILTEEQQKYLEYNVTDLEGNLLQEKEGLSSGDKKSIKITLNYKDDITASDLPTEDQVLTLQFQVPYVQADENVIYKKICIRATTLHTEKCKQTNSSLYCSGAGYTTSGSKGTTTITYGSLGTEGKLTSGDAFDCDVNGDGTFDSATERFYYVSDLDTNSNYAVLIYYNSVAKGIPSNTTTFAYSSDGLGPKTVMLQLPTTSQWTNINLSNTNRDIKREDGTIYVSNFSYEGYSARLLTAEEVEEACNITIGNLTDGALDSCNYLIENTMYSSSGLAYGYWLESIESSYPKAWAVFGSDRSVYPETVDPTIEPDTYTHGARPVIEVKKVNILY